MTCAVYFNLDGTLTANTADFESIYQEAVTQAGLEELKEEYDEYTDRFFNYFQKGWAFPRRQAILDLIQDYELDDLGESDAFAEAWEDAEAEDTTFQDAASSVLETIHAEHGTGVLTNGTGRLQRMKLKDAGVAEGLDAIVISSEVGVPKPNSEIFDIAKDALDADDHIIVSHDLRRDILPGKRAEFKTIWISNAEPDNPQIEKLVDTQVDSLEDVPDAVETLCNS